MKTSKSTKLRQLSVKLFDHLYTFDDKGERLLCAYCGDVRQSIDHIPPISLVGERGTVGLKKMGAEFIKVPCCHVCNNTLNARRIITYGERLAFLYNRLAKAVDAKAWWNNAEIDELSGELKRMVKAKQTHNHRELFLRFRNMERNLAKLHSAND